MANGVGKKKADEAIKTGVDVVATTGLSEVAKRQNEDFQTKEEEAKAEARRRYDELNPADSRLVKAALISRDGAPTIRFMFNPTDLQFSRSVTIVDIKGARTFQGLPKVNFGFVEPYKLKLSGLVFDTYETGEDVYEEKIAAIRASVDFKHFVDVHSGVLGDTGNALADAAGNIANEEVGGGKNITGAGDRGQPLDLKRPPVYYLIWCNHDYITCMVESLSFKLTMFLPDGTPVRALVDLSLKEVDLSVANPGFAQ